MATTTYHTDEEDLDEVFGKACNGCGKRYQVFGPCEDVEDDVEKYLPLELMECEDCGYACCEDCELNSERGTCWCLNSNFSVAYCDMEAKDYFGSSKTGEYYRGPFKSKAQRAFESDCVIYQSNGEPQLEIYNCSHCKIRLAGRPKRYLCSRCRSVVYCSASCQKNDWSRQHKLDCGPYLPPDQWPVISLDLEYYHESVARYPTAMLTPAQRAIDADRQLAQAAINAASISEDDTLESIRERLPGLPKLNATYDQHDPSKMDNVREEDTSDFIMYPGQKKYCSQ